MPTYHQKKLFRAMESAAFYPHPTDPIEVHETHISMVFMTGPWVYKVKKSVDFGFLDFSSLEKRRYYCLRECELNGRLAGNIYQGIAPITCAKDRFHLNGPGPIVEYAVKMRQLPHIHSLRHRLGKTNTSPQFLLKLVSHLTAFYTRQGSSKPDLAADAAKHLRSACENNFQQVLPFIGSCIDRDQLSIVRSATRAFMNRRANLFERRAEGGWIRDCHGDLRSCHIYTIPGKGIQIIDCIEFDDRLRNIDVVSDLAFLCMDLDFQNHSHLGSRLMEIYSRLTSDAGAYLVLPFYKCYRAMVRCKVNCLRHTSREPAGKRRAIEKAQRYLELAYRYAVSFSRPKIWAFSGLPATGKSTLARAMSAATGVPHLRSDAARHRLFRSYQSA